MSEPSVWTRFDEKMLCWGEPVRPERLALRPERFPDPPPFWRPGLWGRHLNSLKFD